MSKIFDTFLEPGGDYSLNIKGKTIQALLKEIHQKNFVNTMFDDVRKEVEFLMNSIILDFHTSEEFLDYKAQDTKRFSLSNIFCSENFPRSPLEKKNSFGQERKPNFFGKLSPKPEESSSLDDGKSSPSKWDLKEGFGYFAKILSPRPQREKFSQKELDDE